MINRQYLTFVPGLAPVSIRMLCRDVLRSCLRGSVSWLASGGGGGAAIWLPNTLVRKVLDGRRSAVGGGEGRELMIQDKHGDLEGVRDAYRNVFGAPAVARKEIIKEKNETKLEQKVSRWRE
jgi:hypothetical protein